MHFNCFSAAMFFFTVFEPRYFFTVFQPRYFFYCFSAALLSQFWSRLTPFSPLVLLL